MMDAASLVRCRLRLADFVANARGVSAVEFALLLPVMLTLYIGSAEVSRAVSAYRKVTLTARTVADLTARVTSVDTTSMNDIFSAGSAVMAPFGQTSADAANVTVWVSQVQIDGNGNPTIAWSCAQNGTAHAVNSPVTLPTASDPNLPGQTIKPFNTPNAYLIWGEVQYNYNTIFSGGSSKPYFTMAKSGYKLYDQMFMAPRLSTSVSGPNPC